MESHSAVKNSWTKLQIVTISLLLGVVFWNALLTARIQNLEGRNPSVAVPDHTTDRRHRRSVPDEEYSGSIRQRSDDGEVKDNINKKRTRLNKSEKRRNNRDVAHFVAYVDGPRFQRMIAEGDKLDLGHVTEHGFNPNDRIYKIWRSKDYTNNRLYEYDAETGKVTVHKKGSYLIYSQIMFHGVQARRSCGIHVNNDDVPFVESFVYTNPRTSNQRAANISSDSEAVEAESLGLMKMRRRVQAAPQYTQCSTMGVVRLKKGDKVFVRSTEAERNIIVKPHLTFWGVVRL